MEYQLITAGHIDKIHDKMSVLNYDIDTYISSTTPDAIACRYNYD